jgi:hypothetical protein
MSKKRNTTDRFPVYVPIRVNNTLRLLDTSVLSSSRVLAGMRHPRPRFFGVCTARSLNDRDVGYIAALAILELYVEVFILACAGFLTITASCASINTSVVGLCTLGSQDHFHLPKHQCHLFNCSVLTGLPWNSLM